MSQLTRFLDQRRNLRDTHYNVVHTNPAVKQPDRFNSDPHKEVLCDRCGDPIQKVIWRDKKKRPFHKVCLNLVEGGGI